MAKKQLAAGGELRFLTPIVPDACFGRLFDCLEELGGIRPFKVTFNDYGLLHRCRHRIKQGRILPVAGRILTRSSLDCAWRDDLFNGGADDKRDMILRYNMQNGMKNIFFGQFAIQELEVNYYPGHFDRLLADQPLALYVHQNQNLLSVGRACFYARMERHPVQGCLEEPACKQSKHIAMKSLWSKKDARYRDDLTGRFPKRAYLRGNAVFDAIEQDMARYEQNDRVFVIV
jgi:hypothetical protein